MLSLTHNFGKEFTICTRWTIFYFLFLIALGDIVLDQNCPEPNGMFPDPKNCSSFYHCDDSVAYHKACSPPLMFNPEKNTCDWPDNVKCGKSKNLSIALLLLLVLSCKNLHVQDAKSCMNVWLFEVILFTLNSGVDKRVSVNHPYYNSANGLNFFFKTRNP